MNRPESSPPPPSPDRRPLNIRLIIGILVMGGVITAAIGLFLITSYQPDIAPDPQPPEPTAAKLETLTQSDLEAMSNAFMTNAFLDKSRQALKKGDLYTAYLNQTLAEGTVRLRLQKWPDEPDNQFLSQRVEEIVFQFEKYGAADPPKAGQAAPEANRYPDESVLPGAGQVNDLFVAGWASEKRNLPEAAIGIYNQALDRLDDLLRSGVEPTPPAPPAPAGETRHSEVPVPPPAADRSAETRYLQKYYAISRRLTELESRAGHEDRAEAIRRRTLAAIDQALARGAETADLNEALDSLLSDLARRERLSGRLESARLTLQRRLGLKQYMLTHAAAESSPTAGGQPASPGTPPDTGLGSAQLPPPVSGAETDGQGPGLADRSSSAPILLDLAWLDRHTFHYDEGLEYLAEIMDTAERGGPAALTETDRQARLAQGEMLMDLGRFQEAELTLQQVRPLPLQQILPGLDLRPGAPPPLPVGRADIEGVGRSDIEAKVTTIRANLALAELRLTQADLSGAEQYMEEAVSLYRTLPGGHPITFDVQLIRVKVLARKGDSRKAERELTAFLADSSKLLASPEVDIWVKRQILALMAEAAWQARARGETELAIEHYRRVNDELTPYITGIDVDHSSEYGSLFRPILVEIMEGEGDLRADLGQMSQAESRYVLGLDMARALRDQEPRQYFWRTRFQSLSGKVERFHYY